MTGDTKVRLAREADLEAIWTLLGQLERVMARPAGTDRAVVDRTLHRLLRRRDWSVFVAEAAGAVVGLLAVQFRDSLAHPGRCALIEELVVDEGWRGRGIGEALVERAVRAARRRGCCEIEVSTERANARARRFYRRMGFDAEALLLEREL